MATINECNHIVTLGYLKDLIGNNLLDSNGKVVHINYNKKDDTYCPIYSDLYTNHIYLPLYNSSSITGDGISVNNNGYSPSQLMMQKDINFYYTRFSSFSISSSANAIGACGGEITLSYIFKVTRHTISMNNTSCSTADTTNTYQTTTTVTYTSNVGTIDGNKLTIPKNSSTSSRQITITATLNYRGTTYDSSSSIVITQSGLTGSYDAQGDRYYTSVEITSYSPTSTTIETCDSLTVSADAKGNYYDRYYWKDICGDIHYDMYEDRDGSEQLDTVSDTFETVLCPTTTSEDSKTLTVEYHGMSDSVTFTRKCTQTCPECDDYYEYAYTSATVALSSACDSTASVEANVPCTAYSASWVEGECKYTPSGGTSATSFTVNVGTNNTQSARTISGTTNYVTYTITQPAGPCGGCDITSTTYKYDDVTVPCEASSSYSTDVNYTKTVKYSNCSDEITTGTSTLMLGSFECNSGAAKIIDSGKTGSTLAEAWPKVTQAGNCTCITCKCEDFPTIQDVQIPYSGTEGISKQICSFGSIDNLCFSLGTLSSSESFVHDLSISAGESITYIYGIVDANDSTSNRTTTITVPFTLKDNTSCTSKTFTLTQQGKACNCDNLQID